jgi:hypothetical protein
MACELLTPGPIQGVALFAVEDNCYTPVYGDDAGYFDSCATVNSIVPVVATSRPEFAKYCPNGNVRAYVPERQVVTTSDVILNYPWLPAEFLATVGAFNPIMFNGEVVGGSPTGEAVNLLALVWQELIGDDACTGIAGAPSLVTPLALRDARFASDGDFGTSGFNYTIVAKTVDANIGSGPIPLFWDEGDTSEAAWPTDCIEITKDGQTRFKAFGPPEVCGVIDTVAPEDACVVAS